MSRQTPRPMPTALRWCAKKGLQFYATCTLAGINEAIIRAAALVLALIATPALANEQLAEGLKRARLALPEHHR